MDIESRFTYSDPPIQLGEGPLPTSFVRDAYDNLNELDCSLKLWDKTGTPYDEDIKRLWRAELRQVQRLMAYTGASRYIVELIGFVEDSTKLGVVLAFSGSPLSSLLGSAHRAHWIRNLEGVKGRRMLWRNVLRLVSALRILHAQGLVHGNISTETVMSEGAEEPDFRLCGFEWCLSVRNQGKPHDQSYGAQGKKRAFSFSQDWLSLGLLICDLLNLGFAENGDLKPKSQESTLEEERLLRRLILPSPTDVWDPHAIYRAVEDIVRGLKDRAHTHAGEFILYVVPTPALANALYQITDGEIEIDDRKAQFEWIEADLEGAKTLMVPPRQEDAQSYLRIVTENLVYRIEPFRNDTGHSWDIGVCRQIKIRTAHLSRPADESHELRQTVFVTHRKGEACFRRDSQQTDTLDWGQFFDYVSDDAGSGYSPIPTALSLIELTASVLRSLEIMPVSVVHQTRKGDRYHIRLAPRFEHHREDLATSLKQPSIQRRLRQIFQKEQVDPSTPWILSESQRLTSTGSNRVDLQFIKARLGSHGDIYEFELSAEPIDSGREWYLRRADEDGNVTAIRRRLANIAALDSRRDLVEMLEDPWRARSKSHERPDTSEPGFLELDRAKQEALEGLWATVPSYFVVGPPGVGKTRLATEVVRRVFGTEPNSRLLISAQGHDALDNLLVTIRQSLDDSGFSHLIVARTDPPKHRKGTPQDLSRAADLYIDQLFRSQMVENAPAPLRDRVRQLAMAVDSREAAHHDAARALRAFSSLFLEAADIVVSTSNSAEIESMVDEHQQFDWVVIEEAAKATGTELIGPLMLSGRRLLIGDHAQLPPFDCDTLQAILEDPASTRAVISASNAYVGNLLEEQAEKDIKRLMLDDALLAAVLRHASALVEPFRSIVSEDENRKRQRGNHRALSSRLNEQRRMDPAIAEIVSRAFYDRELTTAESRIASSAVAQRPYVVGAPLSDSPVVFIDHPHVNSTGKAAHAERHTPRKWHNPSEVISVVEVLKRLQGKQGASPTLAVLAPYAEQVARLKKDIGSRMEGELSHLRQFKQVTSGFVGTVDSFQGREADVVIVSLVRNNPRTGTGALGFLRDPRRLNVLLSRAKYQLILVGSLSFLEAAVRGVNPNDDDQHQLSFISSIVQSIGELSTQSREGDLKLAQILKLRELVGGVDV